MLYLLRYPRMAETMFVLTFRGLIVAWHLSAHLQWQPPPRPRLQIPRQDLLGWRAQLSLGQQPEGQKQNIIVSTSSLVNMASVSKDIIAQKSSDISIKAVDEISKNTKIYVYVSERQDLISSPLGREDTTSEVFIFFRKSYMCSNLIWQFETIWWLHESCLCFGFQQTFWTLSGIPESFYCWFFFTFRDHSRGPAPPVFMYEHNRDLRARFTKK